MIKNAIRQWNNLSLPAKATIWYTICSVLQKGISFIVVPIFTRTLSTEQYGIYSIYQSIQSVVTIIVTFNLGAAPFNVCAKKCTSKQRGGMAVSLMGLSVLLGIVGYIIWIAINVVSCNGLNNVLGLADNLVGLMFLQIIVGALTGIWSADMRYTFAYRPLIIYTLLLSALNPITSLVAFQLFEASAKVRIVSVVILEVILGTSVCIKFILENIKEISRKWWKFATVFSIPLIPHYLSMTVLSQANRIMIGAMIGNTAAAIYSVAFNVGIIINFFTTSINSAFIPFVYESMNEKKYDAIKRASEGLLLFVGIMVVGVVALAPEIMKILAPIEYYEAIWIIPPVALSSFFIFAYSLFANIEFYFEKNKYVMVASCIGAILNIILNVIFLPIFGYLVAGYITLFCYILFTVAHYLFYLKTLKSVKFSGQLFSMRRIGCFGVFLTVLVMALSFCYKISLLRYGLIIFVLLIIILKRKIVFSYIKTISAKEK